MEKVTVTVLDGEGKPLEKGEGTRSKGDWWEFRPASKLQGMAVYAEARDLPRHVTRFVH